MLLVFDIGTEAVKAIIFKKEKQNYVIVGYFSEYFDRFGVFDSRDFEKDVLKKAILKVCKALESQVDPKKTIILWSFPPNFLKARVILQTQRRSNFKNNIDGREEKEISQAVLKEAKQKIFQDFAKISGILPQDLEVLSQEIIEIKIDGYGAPKLQGYKGENLELRILTIFIPKYYLQNFKKIIKDLGLEIFKIIHPAQNINQALRRKDAIFLDIGGEVTQIFLIRNGVLEVIDDFEMGGRDFSRLLSQTLGLNEEESRVLKENYSNGVLSEESRWKIKELFSEVAKEWKSRLKSKLKSLKGLLPQTFFLYGGGSRLPEIEEVLSEEGWEVKYQSNIASLWLK